MYLNFRIRNSEFFVFKNYCNGSIYYIIFSMALKINTYLRYKIIMQIILSIY